MSFLSGRASFARFRLTGAALRDFSQSHLDKLNGAAFGSQRLASADGVEVGWTTGEHILDTDFEFEKNVIGNALHFAFRVDTEKPPADLLHAYAAMELKSEAPVNPSPRQSAKRAPPRGSGSSASRATDATRAASLTTCFGTPRLASC